ncbi:MAG: transposase [Gemmataceae bacterium]
MFNFHARLRERLPNLVVGILLAQGRRTVTSWLRAAGITNDFGQYYYWLKSLGKKVQWGVCSLLRVLIQKIDPGPRWVFAIDDSPTKRYGKRIDGAGYHHNPTKGPTNQKYLFGHIWVTIAWIVKTPGAKALALPLLSKLYIKAKDVAKLTAESGEWKFQTKLQLAGELLAWLAKWLTLSGKDLWVVFDGAYNKKTC